MEEKQQTVKNAVAFSGRGLHTGINTKATIHPAGEDHGIVFQRIDLKEKPRVRALAEFVRDTSRGTTLEENLVRVMTVEHIMAALAGLNINNALIELEASEVPILDGSSKHYVDNILQAGIQRQDKERKCIVIDKKIEFRDPDNNVEIAIYPDTEFHIDVKIDYGSKVIGNQYASFNHTNDFVKEIAASRTFVFLHELEFLLKNNLIKGGDLDNAIIIIDRKTSKAEMDRLAELFNKPRVSVQPEGILNNVELLYDNEPARHKLLDLIGDLALIGHPIRGRVIALRPGHYANTEVAKMIRKKLKKIKNYNLPEYDPARSLMSVNGIKRLLPHRPPFLLVDKILYQDEKTVVGIKNVTVNEGFFVGHFPKEPIMPGVLQIEAMAQVGGILVLNTVPDPENYQTLFLKIDRVKFKQKVIPGDTLILQMDLMEPIRRGIAHMYGHAIVNDNIVCEGELMARIIKAERE